MVERDDKVVAAANDLLDLRGGYSTEVECMPCKREVLGTIPARCWAVFLCLSSVMCPNTGTPRKSSCFSFKK